MANYSTIETLPDEVLLQICSYLRSSDVLYSFFDLNTRINTAIEGYCRYINLLAPAYKPFHHVLSYVLPRIGSSVRSFVLNGNWKPVLSEHLADILYGAQLANLLPQLERLTLKWFTCDKMSLLLDNFGNFPQLHTLEILILNGTPENNLLGKILTANHGQLKTISIDNDCVGLDIPDGEETISYPNIEELIINVSSNRSFSPLTKMLPNVKSLHVSIDGHLYHPTLDTDFRAFPSLVHLTDFRLRSINIFWTLEKILELLHIMPALQKLALDIRSDDERFMQASHLAATIPSSITQLDLYIRYYPNEGNTGTKTLITSWSNYRPVACFPDDSHHRIIFYTVPVTMRSLALSADVAQQMDVSWTHFQFVEDLYIYDATHLAQLFGILQHFHRLRTLNINARSSTESLDLTPLPKPVTLKLSRLEKFTVTGRFPLLAFVEAAPNLESLDVEHPYVEHLLNDQQTCDLLRHRINRLDIYEWPKVDFDLLKRISQVFIKLQQLILAFNDTVPSTDPMLIEALDCWKDRGLQWIFLGGTLSDEAKQNPRQWLIEHSHVLKDVSFSLSYDDNWVTLWKS